MKLVETANQLIRDCESQIRALIESALTERQYEEIAHLASLASALSAVGNRSFPERLVSPESSVANGSAIGSSDSTSANNNSTEVRRSAEISKQRANQYPRFERHGDRLVKLGWSKKDRSVYEHRAPVEVVRAVAAKLGSSARKGAYLRMDEMLPIRAGDGAEVPSYQAYLVLAWLREMGAVRRLGNDGYKLIDKHLDEQKVEDLWIQTPERT